MTSNIQQFMQDQKFANFEQLYSWSITQRQDFWSAAIKTLKIKFVRAYTAILDPDSNPEQPNWLTDAKLNIVDSCFQASPNKTAIIARNNYNFVQTLTYQELLVLTNRVANSLIKFGLKPGDAVAIDMLMTVEAVGIYLGIIKAGCVAVGIADSFAATEVLQRVNISKARLVFTQDIIMRAGKQLAMYDKIKSPDLPPIVVIANDNKQLQINLANKDIFWQDFLVSDAEFTAIACNPHDPSNILFSSGTTGVPKAIVWDHTSPIKCAIDGYLYQDIQPADIVAWPTSLGWMMGPWLIYATLINRATMALYSEVPTSRDFVEFVAAAKVSILGLVPSIVKHWRAHNILKNTDWSAIKLFSSTGETSNPSDMQFLSEYAGNKPIIEYCGGTEISGAYITSTLLQQNIPAQFSTPCLGIELLLIDEHGQEVQDGEVALIGPSIGLSRVLLNRDNFQEYYADMPLSKTGIRMRRHGDHMQRLNNGYYKSLGRVDDAMNLGGIKVSAAAIEHCFVEIPELLETAAVGINAESGLTELVIYVVLRDQVNIDLTYLKQQMQNNINTKLNPLFKIAKIVVIEQLPRTNSNKIMRRVLRDNPL